jgi:hypothetical protein
MRGRVFCGVAAAIALAGGGGASALAAASSTPASGNIVALIHSNGSGSSSIIVTGAIGDSGTTTDTSASGQVQALGDYAKVTLSQGGFMVNKTKLETATQKLQPPINQTTCSAAFSVTEPVSLYDGTGLYKGIAGTLKVNEFEAFVSPRYTSGKNAGKCNFNATPTAVSGLIVATGSVSF